MVRIVSVQPLEPWQVRLDLTDGSSCNVDLAPLMNGPIFDALIQGRPPARPMRASA
jgi:hypothetical protein